MFGNQLIFAVHKFTNYIFTQFSCLCSLYSLIHWNSHKHKLKVQPSLIIIWHEVNSFLPFLLSFMFLFSEKGWSGPPDTILKYLPLHKIPSIIDIIFHNLSLVVNQSTIIDPNHKCWCIPLDTTDLHDAQVCCPPRDICVPFKLPYSWRIIISRKESCNIMSQISQRSSGIF